MGLQAGPPHKLTYTVVDMFLLDVSTRNTKNANSGLDSQ